MGYFSHIVGRNARFMATFMRHRHRREISIKKGPKETRFKKGTGFMWMRIRSIGWLPSTRSSASGSMKPDIFCD
jgi:hypothetical protein